MSGKKTRKQVGRFLADVTLASEEDEHLIRLFLRKHKTKAPIGFGENQSYSASNGLTAVQFEEWYSADLPEVGDVLWCDEMKAVGLVTGVGGNSITVGAVMATDNRLSLEERHIPNPKCKQATADQISSLQKSLAAHGWDWNPRKQKLVRREVPTSPKYVRLMEFGRQVGIGVFKSVRPDGTLEMFCVKLGREPIRILDNAVLRDVNQFSFMDAFDEHRAAIQRELGEYGYIWNSKRKRIQKDDARLKVGMTYYWINAMLEIKHSVEKNQANDYKKFIRGNYFRTRQGAERARDIALNAFKEIMLSEQE